MYHHRTQADGGEGTHISEMIKAFQDSGHSVKVVALVNKEKGNSRKNTFWKFIAKFSPKILYELMEIVYNFIGYFKLLRAMQIFRPHLIYERYSLHNVAGTLAAKTCNIPLLLEVNSPLAYEKEKYDKLVFQKLARNTEKWIFSNADKVMAVSNVLRKYLIEIGIPSEKIYVIPNGVDIKRFCSNNKTIEIRNRYGLDGKTIIGFCGFFKKWHNLEMLLEIINEIKNRNLNLVLIGDGPELESLKKYVQEHVLQDYVIFVGRVSRQEIPEYIDIFDIALLPSITSYASPLKIFEYMAMGKAIIAPRMENIEEVLVDSSNALLFAPNNKSELKDAIHKLVSSPELRGKLGNNAKQDIFKKGYLWKNNVERVVKIYKDCYAV